jgi:hypothetical protein
MNLLRPLDLCGRGAEICMCAPVPRQTAALHDDRE